MPIFKRRPPSATPGGWHPDGNGVQDGGDDVRYQVGKSYLVRLRSTTCPGSAIDLFVYVVNYGDALNDFYVQVGVDWVIFEDPDDPGGTEVWGLERDCDMPELFDNWDDAARCAALLAGYIGDGWGRLHLTEFLDEDMVDMIFDWDGQPFGWNEAA
jgi:hypothetical protein